MSDQTNPKALSCGLCFEEQGEEVHPHPECPIGSTAPPRLTVDTITSDQLDALYDQLERAETDLNAFHEADSADAAAGSYAGRAEQAEAELMRLRTESPWLRATAEDLAAAQAAIERVRDALAHDHHDDCRYSIGCDVALAALDEPKEPTP